MKKKLLLSIALLCSTFGWSQVTCPILNGPFNNDVNVPVDAVISWTAVTGVPGYIISIGTTPGGTDIVNNRNIGSATQFQPPLGLPQNSDIYVSLTVFFFNADNIQCNSERFRTTVVTARPACTAIRFPLNGATNVNVASNITWDYASSATGYRVSIGTTTGGIDVLNNEDVGNILTYNPPTDFAFNTEFFVRITPYNENGSAQNICSETSFITGDMATIPGCATLENPFNGAVNVPLTPRLEWTEITAAEGYRVTIGMSPNTAEVLDNVVFTTSSTLILDFEPNRTFFIKIVPFNSAGEAIGCAQETFSTIMGCGPLLDRATGALVNLNPEIVFPDLVSICENNVPFTVVSDNLADGYRWFRIDSGGNETLISNSVSVELTDIGSYRYEIYNTFSSSGNTYECSSSKEFTVVSSAIPTISSVEVTGQNNKVRITIMAAGTGDYEYALDNIDGPYQESNFFENLSFGSYTVYVRDKNGCGVAQENVTQDLTLEGFPKFFTPNGDGINDYWQFIPLVESGEINVGTIRIFDRYGMLVKQIDPLALGWDGTLNGRPMPSSDYWFTAISLTTRTEVKGHFTLKR